MNKYVNRLKRNREKGIAEYKNWNGLKVSDVIFKPEPGDTYQDYINRIYTERPNFPWDTFRYEWELHHINPRCKGGPDTKENTIWLLTTEHFWAHLLLYKENIGHKGLHGAILLILNRLDEGIFTKEDLDYIKNTLNLN